LQPKWPAGQEKGEQRVGHTVDPFDEPGGDFGCNPKGRGPFGLSVAAAQMNEF
jgi:hypothetical protein